jgi:putative membrane protein
MILVWVFGLSSPGSPAPGSRAGSIAKFALVLALSAIMAGWSATAASSRAGERPVSGRALRMMNEVPGIAVVLIVVLVIVRPF